MFLSGVDGDASALELIKLGGAYKLSIAFAWSLMGYGLGQFGADWIEGKRGAARRRRQGRAARLGRGRRAVRQRQRRTRPSVFDDRARYEEYLPLYGNVSHATRDDVLDVAGRPAVARLPDLSGNGRRCRPPH